MTEEELNNKYNQKKCRFANFAFRIISKKSWIILMSILTAGTEIYSFIFLPFLLSVVMVTFAGICLSHTYFTLKYKSPTITAIHLVLNMLSTIPLVLVIYLNIKSLGSPTGDCNNYTGYQQEICQKSKDFVLSGVIVAFTASVFATIFSTLLKSHRTDLIHLQKQEVHAPTITLPDVLATTDSCELTVPTTQDISTSPMPFQSTPKHIEAEDSAIQTQSPSNNNDDSSLCFVYPASIPSDVTQIPSSPSESNLSEPPPPYPGNDPIQKSTDCTDKESGEDMPQTEKDTVEKMEDSIDC